MTISQMSSSPLVLAARVTERLELSTEVAIALARTPMTVATIANDLQLLSKGRFTLGLGSQIKPHVERRFSMTWSHPAARMASSSSPYARSGLRGAETLTSISAASSTRTRS
jgi:alkanesulfonate monooxygenase SsuD/methylene tetrahydromethanopterin reductase-like flavin-dependent oxidoreductase (luciferase family)